MLNSCNIGSKDTVRGDIPASSDTIALLRQVETMYDDDQRPDRAVLEMFMRVPEFKKRGVPEHLSIIGIIPEDRVTLCNYASAEDILGKKHRFLEAEWSAYGNEFLGDADPPLPNPSKGFLRMSYEILPDTLIPVDSFYYDEGFEF
ncbi:MAG: hypothetical protein K2G90_09885 [Muribaculaceae bacterium]|nr:hypothetical protein [Muribaculaceae bacterium]